MANALKHRDYRVFFTGSMFSRIGEDMQEVAEDWLVFVMTGSPFLLGLVAFCKGPSRVLLAPVFGAVIARPDSQRDRSICLDQDAVGTKPWSVVPKRSTSGDVEDVPCGTSETFRTYASPCALSIAIKPRPSRKCRTRAERRRGQRPQAARNARSQRSGER